MSLKKYLLAAAMVAAFILPAIGQTAGQGTRIKSGSSVPGSCIDSSGNTEIFIKTGTGPYYCDGGTYAAVGGGGSGTVTSVGLSAPSTFSVGGTPVTGSGTLALTYNVGAADEAVISTAANTASWSSITNCGDASHALSYSTTTHTFGCQSITNGGSAHNLLSSTHSDTTAASAVRGDIIAAIGASPLWTRVAHSSTTGGYWKWNGTDTVASTGAAGGTGACSAHNFETTDNADAAPTCAQPAVADLQSIAADAVVQNSSGSSAAPVATAVPNCANDGAHALIYSTSSHTWACQSISGAGTLCPTCFVGPDSSVIGGIVGTFPNSGFPSPSTSLPLNPFASSFTTNSGLVMPFNAGFRNMYVKASGMTTGSSFVDFQRDAAGSSPTSTNRSGFAGVSIYPNAATGDYSSAWPLQVWPIQKGDVFEIISYSIGSSVGVLRGMSWETVGSSSQLLGTDLIARQVALSTTVFTGPSQSNSITITTEALQGVIVPYAATAKGLCIRYISAQSATGSLVLTLRKNGTTSTALTTTIAASGLTGTQCDFTDTVSLAAGDWIDFQLQNNATASSTQIIGLTMELASPTAPATGMIVFGTGNQTIGSGTARFASPFSTVIGTTEANARAPLPRALTMKNLSCIYTTPPGTNPVVATIMQNGSASALTVSIPTTGAGTQTITDSTHSVAFVAGDEVSLQLNQSSGTNPAISSCSVEVD